MSTFAIVSLVVIVAGLLSGLLVALGWSLSTDKRLSTRFMAGFILLSLFWSLLAKLVILTVPDVPRWADLLVTPAVFAISYLWLVGIRLYREIGTNKTDLLNENENMRSRLEAHEARLQSSKENEGSNTENEN